MNIGCCTTVDNYNELAKIGYKTITLAGKDISAMTDGEYEHAKRIILNGPLRTEGVNTFCAPQLRLNGEGFTATAVEAYTCRLCKRAKPLGIVSIGVGAPNSRRIAPDYPSEKALDEFSEALRTMCSVAAKFDMQILLEALATVECNCVTTTSEALALVRSLALPNLHMVYDIYHAFMMDEEPASIREAVGEIRTVHISGYGDNKRPYLSQPSFTKLVPYIQELKACGYDGELSVEAFAGDIHEGFRETYRLLSIYC